MQKSTKRLLSMLVVLALVLGFAPAGILAVETKAAAGDANLPAGVADLKTAGAAKQVAAKAMIGTNLEGTDQATRLEALNATTTACPFCNAADPTWETPSTTAANKFGGTDGNRHFYVYRDFDAPGSTLYNLFQGNGGTMCLLMDDANITFKGRVLIFTPNSTCNIGGTGVFASTMTATSDTGNGVFRMSNNSATANNTLNLYGGTFRTNFTGSSAMHKGVIYTGGVDNTVNLWSQDVVIGPEESTAPGTTGAQARMNVRINPGKLNLYDGYIQNGYAEWNSQGWNVMLAGAAEFNMYGGVVQGGSGANGCKGANIMCYAGGTQKVNIYGGTVTGGRTGTANTGFGGNVYLTSGATLDIKGGNLLGGLTGTLMNAYHGGNIYALAGSIIKISGTANVSGGHAAGQGGNIYAVSGADAQITGGYIQDGMANYPGGNLRLMSAQSISGATITGGSSRYSHGGNIAATGNLTLDATTTVSDGVAPQNGGNIYLLSGTLTTNATITGGWSKNAYNAEADATANPGGGNIYLEENTTANIGGIVSGGRATANGGNICICAGANVTITGTVSQGTLPENSNNCGRLGGGIYAEGATLNVTNAASVTDCTAGLYGGNIYLQDMVSATIAGTVSGGWSQNGGNIAVEGGNATITGAVSDGEAKYGGNIALYEGNAYAQPATNTEDAAKAYDVIISGNMTGGTATLGAWCNNVIASSTYGKNSTITLSGTAAIDPGFYFVDGIKLALADGWTGSAVVNAAETYRAGDVVPTTRISYAGTYAGTITNASGDALELVTTANAGELALPAFAVVNDEGITGYTSAQAAMDAYEEGDLLVASDDVTIAGEVIIDATDDITVSGTGMVYGVDRDNNNFDNNTGSITPNGVSVAKEKTYNDIRYIALTGDANDVNNGAKYTFHRLQVKLTNVTINPDKAGLYYKAEYKFDDKVAARAESYGVFVALNQAATASSPNFTSADVADATIENHTLASASHGVYGIFKTTREPAANIAASKSVINGNPYITINWNGAAHEASDADYIYMGTNVAKSLESAIQLADEKWEDMTETSKETLNAFVEHWNNLGAFDTAVLEALTNVGK